MEGLEQYDIVDATMRPLRTDDLRPEAAAWVGVRTFWQAMWVIERGRYAGQWAFGMAPAEALVRLELGAPVPRFGWAPECDFEIHGLVLGGVRTG